MEGQGYMRACAFINMCVQRGAAGSVVPEVLVVVGEEMVVSHTTRQGEKKKVSVTGTEQ